MGVWVYEKIGWVGEWLVGKGALRLPGEGAHMTSNQEKEEISRVDASPPHKTQERGGNDCAFFWLSCCFFLCMLQTPAAAAATAVERIRSPWHDLALLLLLLSSSSSSFKWEKSLTRGLKKYTHAFLLSPFPPSSCICTNTPPKSHLLF